MTHHRSVNWGRWFLRALLCVMWMGPTGVRALTVSNADTYSLSPEWSWLTDDAGTLTVRDALSPGSAKQFQSGARDGRAPSLGYRDTTLWLKAVVDVSPHAPSLWLIQIANPQLDSIEVFVLSPGGQLSRTSGGDHMAFSERAVPHRHHVFPLTFATSGSHTLVLRVRSTSSLRIPVTLLQPQALLSQDHRVYSVLSLYFGLLAGLFAYNLLLYLSIKDGVYLRYIAFVAAMAFAQLAMTGFGAQFVWPERPDWNDAAPHLGHALSGLTAILFARRFLHSKAELPRLDRVLRWMLVGWVLFVLVLPWMGSEMAAALLIAMTLCSILPLMLAGLDRWCARRTGARYFLLAWALLMVGAVAESLLAIGSLPAHALLAHPLMAGSACEMLLLSFALADRIKSERRARELAVSVGQREQVKKQEAERLSVEKSRFLAAVSHDLRQPLFALSLAAESLRARAPLHEPLVQQMKSALQSANGLLDSVMTMARLESGALRASMVNFSVQPLLERVDLTFEPQALAKGLRWVVTPSIVRVHSDPVLLERMVSNLVSNAVRFTRSGGIVVSCRRNGPCLLLQVWDTGPGIDPAHHQTIFSEYFRGEPDTDKDNGVGLGLSIVKSCAGMLGIGLSVRSVPGRGSCFSLRVPLARGGPARSAGEALHPPAPPSPTEGSV